VGLTPTETPSKDHLKNALHAAKRSTASVGKFTKSLRTEKPGSENRGKKRKVCKCGCSYQKEDKDLKYQSDRTLADIIDDTYVNVLHY
jgi:regulator of ribosome biosynthesis